MSDEWRSEEERRMADRRKEDREETLIRALDEINRPKTWWDGNQTRVWRMFIVFFIALVCFFSSWIFNNVDKTKTDMAALSGKFATKDELKCAVDRIELTINRGFDNFDRKLEDTNKYLRDNAGHIIK